MLNKVSNIDNEVNFKEGAINPLISFYNLLEL